MISVVVPAHNEREYLQPAVEAVLTSLRHRGYEFEIIVSENGSSDGTADLAKRLEKENVEVKVITSPVADYGSALRAGFLEASGELVVYMDVDLVDMDFLEQAVAMLRSSDLAIVVGSKRGPGADDRRSLPRQTITAVFSLLLRVGFGLPISDTHGLKALRRAPLVGLVQECRFGKDIFDTELVIRADRAGLRVGEIPVVVEETRPPRSSILGRIPRTLVGLVRLRLTLGPRRAAPSVTP